MTARVSDKDTR